MAKDDSKPKETKVDEVVRVVTSRTVDERVAALVSEGRDFPDPSEIEIHEPFKDIFEPPSWCDPKLYAYAWVDIADDIQLERAIHHDYWQLVTLSNHPQARRSDFRVHGAVERRGMVLVYRPLELELRLRYLGVKQHMETAAALKEGDKGPNWERSMEVGVDVPAPGFKPVVGELAGQEGIVSKSGGED